MVLSQKEIKHGVSRRDSIEEASEKDENADAVSPVNPLGKVRANLG